jgi:hypothetical protein
MYRQANYFDSVGEDRHYEWQTPKHNFWCLIVSFILLVLVFILFYAQNKPRLDEFDVTVSDSEQNLSNFEFHIDYGKPTDFNRRANYGKTSTLNNDEFNNENYNGFRLYATCDIDREKYKENYNKGMAISRGSWVDEFVRNQVKDPNANAEYCLNPFQKMQCDVQLYSPYVSSIFSSIAKYKYTEKHPDELKNWYPYKGLYSVDKKQFYRNDTLYNENAFTLYRAVEYVVKCDTDTIGTIYNKLENGEVEKKYKVAITERNQYAFFDPDTFYSFYKTMYIGGIRKRFNPLINTSLCNFQINHMQFPNAKTNRLVISFNSPMNYDILSIKPDSVTDTQLIYYSPENISRIERGDLYVCARSIASMNIQETWNFIYATIIGIIISFGIEYWKRLYNYRRQRIHVSGRKYRFLEKGPIGILLMFWWIYDKCKCLFVRNKSKSTSTETK